MEQWRKTPCNYEYKEAYYSMLPVWNEEYPTTMRAASTTSPSSNPKVYFNFCEKLYSTRNFADLGCNLNLGSYYAVAVSVDDPPVCTALSTDKYTSITNTTWNNGTHDLLSIRYQNP